jgi:hypothetical protein
VENCGEVDVDCGGDCGDCEVPGFTARVIQFVGTGWFTTLLLLLLILFYLAYRIGLLLAKRRKKKEEEEGKPPGDSKPASGKPETPKK